MGNVGTVKTAPGKRDEYMSVLSICSHDDVTGRSVRLAKTSSNAVALEDAVNSPRSDERVICMGTGHQ